MTAENLFLNNFYHVPVTWQDNAHIRIIWLKHCFQNGHEKVVIMATKFAYQSELSRVLHIFVNLPCFMKDKAFFN